MSLKKKSVKRNYIYNTSLQVFKIITPLVTTPYISRVLNADGIGIYSYIAAIVSNFIIFAGLGTGMYGQRETAYLQNDSKKRSVIFWEIEILNLCSVGITILCYIVFAFMRTDNNTIYWICILQLFTVAFDVSWVFAGMEDFSKIAIRDFLFKVLNVIGVFLLVKTQQDLWKYALLLSGVPMFSAISFWVYLPKYIVKVPLKSLKPFRHLKGTIALFIPTIAIQVYSVLDKVMLGAIAKDAFENGYYEQSYKIIKILLTLVASLGTVLIPRMGVYFSQNNRSAINISLKKSVNFIWFLACPMCFGVIGCAENFIPWFFGSNYLPMLHLMQILSVLIIIVGLNNITGLQILVPMKQQNIFTVTVCLGAMVNLALNAALIPTMKSEGAAISTVVAESVVLFSEIWMLRKEFSIKIFITGCRNCVIASIVMCAILLLENEILSSSIGSTIVMIFTGGLIYISVLFFLKDKFLIEYLLAEIKKI